jgi:hypothetical protein
LPPVSDMISSTARAGLDDAVGAELLGDGDA